MEDDAGSGSSEGSFDDWKSDAEEKEPSLCLLCEYTDTPRLVLRHCAAEHDFDVVALLKAKGTCFTYLFISLSLHAIGARGSSSVSLKFGSF